ncbi:MAG TPA: hypothetical protein VFX16_32365 [Pseudonocardiaceae bacterium]|nr:hypothetical protein [Pseudonocardiaceae bacterium]
MDNERVLFIVVGIVITIAVGQLLMRSGRRYLAGSVPAERAAAGPAANLVAVLFHLLTLGIIALISVWDVGSTAETRFLVQFGVLLVVLAGIYSVALLQINRRREDALVADFEGHSDVGVPTPENGLQIRPADPTVDGPVVRPRGETRLG